MESYFCNLIRLSIFQIDEACVPKYSQDLVRSSCRILPLYVNLVAVALNMTIQIAVLRAQEQLQLRRDYEFHLHAPPAQARLALSALNSV